MAGGFAEVIRAQIAEDAAREAAATPAPEATPEVAAPEVTAAPEATPTPEATATPAPESEKRERPAPPQSVALSKYNAVHREKTKAEQQLADALAREEALQKQLQDALAAQKPAAAAQADATATDGKDWIDQLLEAGAEIPPELVDNLRKQQNRIDKLEQKVGSHGQSWEAVQRRQAEADYDAGLSRMAKACPNFTVEDIEDMLADGIKPHVIKAHHDQMALRFAGSPATASAPAATPAAAGPKPTPVPQLDAPRTPSAAAQPENMTREQYRAWLRQQFSSSVH